MIFQYYEEKKAQRRNILKEKNWLATDYTVNIFTELK